MWGATAGAIRDAIQFWLCAQNRYCSDVPALREDSPEYWRDLAVRTRDVAERMKDQLSKQMMLMIADDYDRLAAAIEKEIQTSKTPK